MSVAVAAVPSRSAVRACFDLARAGNFPSVASNVLAALVLSAAIGPRWPAATTLALAVLAGCLIYAGGATFNDVADAEIDARDRPERAIPQRLISRSGAAGIASLEMIAGLGLLVWAGASAVWAAALAVTILAYDWIHKRWSGSVFLMAGCRALLALTLATLPGQRAGIYFWAWVGALFVYIVTLSVLARRENKAVQLVQTSVEQEAAQSSPMYSATSAHALRSPRRKRGSSIGRLLAFIPMIDALALLLAGAWIPAMVCAATVPLGRWAQRLAAST